MKQFIANLLGEEEGAPYDKSRYALTHLPQGESVLASPVRLYGAPPPQGNRAVTAEVPEQQQAAVEMGCWLHPAKSCPTRAASRQLASDSVVPRVTPQIAVPQAGAGAGNTAAEFNSEIFRTPFDQAQPLEANGTLINTHTGEVSQLYSDAFPPPDRQPGDIKREMKNSQLRLIAAGGNAPLERRKREQEHFMPAPDAGPIMQANNYKVQADVHQENVERQSRDSYFNRKGFVPAEQEATRNPYGFDGYVNCLRIQPHMPVTQELDTKKWTPNSGQLPSTADAPRARTRLHEDAAEGRPGVVTYSAAPEPAHIMSDVRRSLTGLHAQEREAATRPHMQENGAKVSVQAELATDVELRNTSSRGVLPAAGAQVPCATAESVLATLRGAETRNGPVSMSEAPACFSDSKAVISQEDHIQPDVPRPQTVGETAAAVPGSADVSKTQREARGARYASAQISASSANVSIRRQRRPEWLISSETPRGLRIDRTANASTAFASSSIHAGISDQRAVEHVYGAALPISATSHADAQAQAPEIMAPETPGRPEVLVAGSFAPPAFENRNDATLPGERNPATIQSHVAGQAPAPAVRGGQGRRQQDRFKFSMGSLSNASAHSAAGCGESKVAQKTASETPGNNSGVSAQTSAASAVSGGCEMHRRDQLAREQSIATDALVLAPTTAASHARLAPIRAPNSSAIVMDVSAHANTVNGQIELASEKALADKQGCRGAAREIAADDRTQKQFARDARGLNDGYRAVGFEKVPADASASQCLLNQGAREWRAELVIAPVRGHPDIAAVLQQGATKGRMLTPHKRQLRVARSPRPAFQARCSAVHLTDAPVSRCVEVEDDA